MYKPTLHDRKIMKRFKIIERRLTEAFDQETLNDAVQIIKSLRSIDFAKAGLKTLASARDAAMSDVEEILGGQSRQGLIKKLTSMFTKTKNPLIDVLAFCDALRNFFMGLSKYVEARKVGVQDAESKIFKNIMLNTQDGVQTIASITDDKKQIKNLENLLINGLKPEKSFKKLATNAWQKSYLKNKYGDIARDIMNATVKNVEEISTDVIDKFQNVSTIARAAMNVGGGSTKATQGSTTTEPAAASSTSSGSTTSQAGFNDKTKSKQDSLSIADEVYSELNDRFGDVPEGTVKKIIAILAHNDMIKQ